MEKDLEKIFKNLFENEKFEFNENLSAKDIASWDSLRHVVLLMEVEKFFKIKFTLKEVRNLNNVGDLLQAIKAKSKS